MNQQEALYLARNSFKTYISLLCPYYIFTPFHEFLINELQDVLDGKTTRLCVSVPPRHGKSQLISELLPSFAFARNPLEQIMTISYSSSLATEFGYKVRNNLNSQLHQSLFPWSTIPGEGKSGKTFKLAPMKELEAKYPEMDWDIPDLYRGFGSGSYFAGGVGSGIAGRAVSLGLIDDSLANRQQADSPAYISRLHQFFGPDLFSRLEPSAKCIVVNTRWSNQDLIGYILKNMEGWKYLRLPAICDSEDDPLGRSIGEPLFPEKYDLDALAEIRATNTERDWQALYQQNTITGSTNLWKPSYTRIVDPTEIKTYNIERHLIAYDCASELHELADYTAITIWGMTANNNLYLKDTIEAKMEFPQLIQTMKELNSQYRNPLHIVEKASNGTALGQFIKQNHPEINLELIPTSKSKITRMSLCTPAFKKGKVYFYNDADNLDTLLGQFSDLVGSDNDDLADSAMLAILYAENYEGIEKSDSGPPIKVLSKKSMKFNYGVI